MAEAEAEGCRGIHFLCFVADLERQYEFVQQTWINSRKFAGLGNDADPLLSNPALPRTGLRNRATSRSNTARSTSG